MQRTAERTSRRASRGGRHRSEGSTNAPAAWWEHGEPGAGGTPASRPRVLAPPGETQQPPAASQGNPPFAPRSPPGSEHPPCSPRRPLGRVSPCASPPLLLLAPQGGSLDRPAAPSHLPAPGFAPSSRKHSPAFCARATQEPSPLPSGRSSVLPTKLLLLLHTVASVPTS